MGMSCLDCHDYMDGFNRGKREGVIEELEKIKIEVNDIHNWCKPQMVKNDFITLLNIHISKLKGETNEKK